jgi:hypothetical protein
MSWVDNFDSRLSEVLTKYSPDQPRDENGQFASVDGGSGSSEETSSWKTPDIDAWQEAGHITRTDLSEAEANAVTSYTGSDYRDINFALRYGDRNVIDESTQNTVNTLISVIDRNEPLPEDSMLYRGVHNSGGHWNDLQVGDRFVEKGFTSTSPDLRTAKSFGNKLMEIEAPAGTKAIDTYTALTGGVRESEVVLQAGTEYEVMANGKGEALRLRVVNG